MYCLIVISLMLPSISQQYTIKVQGKVELGNQLAELFQEICTLLFEKVQSDSKPTIKPENKHRIAHQKPKDAVKIFTIENKDEKSSQNGGNKNINVFTANNVKMVKYNDQGTERPLLDEILSKHEAGKVHVYGKHHKKTETHLRPLNNIHI